MKKKPKLVRQTMGQILCMVLKGELHAVRSLHSHSVSDVKSTFGHLQTGENIGKLVVKMEPSADVSVSFGAQPSRSFQRTIADLPGHPSHPTELHLLE